MKGANYRLIDYIEHLQSEGQYWFLCEEARAHLGLSPAAFKLAAARLALKNRLQRIRADFYTIVPLEYRSSGSLPVTWFINDFMAHNQADYYVGLLSAAALHGAAHQQPMAFQVISNQLMSSINVGQLRINFHYKKSIKPEFYQPIKTATGDMQVSTPEMTLCDLIRYMDAVGQINNVATIAIELIDQIHLDKLISFAEHGDIETATIQRIGYLLQYLNLPVDLVPLEKIVSKKHPHYRALVTGSNTPIIETNKRWRILVNEAIEADI
jgi:predicted transcriptional regulator of viral defense system